MTRTARLTGSTPKALRLTWPMYRRLELLVDGELVRLGRLEMEIVLLLLIRRHFVSANDIIEFCYPNPDLEPDYCRACVSVFIHRMRHKGVPIVTILNGYTLAIAPAHGQEACRWAA